VARLNRMDLMWMALRASLLQATWNFERQQGLGWAFSLKPALDRLIPDPAARASRLAEHTAYFNTQPTLASIALGAVAELEEQRAAGGPLDGDVVARIKGALGSALAAMGDRLFWLTLRPWVAILGVMVALVGSWRGALAMWICYNLVHGVVRWRGVTWGYREGPQVLNDSLRAGFERLVRRLAVSGAALTGVLVAMLLVPGGDPRNSTFQVLLMAGLMLGLLTTTRARPTPTQWAVGFGALTLMAAWLR
jgi:mannose/fructose/N-acetylgalactosamine-specific phosphotransferase system component IID